MELKELRARIEKCNLDPEAFERASGILTEAEHAGILSSEAKDALLTILNDSITEDKALVSELGEVSNILKKVQDLV